jgi:hypothetical protein
VAEENTNEEVLNKKVEVPEIEIQARERGWKPKEEYTGAEGSWTDADEFMRRAPLYEGLHKANRTIKKLEKMVTGLAQHNKEVEKAAYDKALNDLKAQKKIAATNNDLEKVVEIEERIDVVEAKKAKVEKEPVKEEANEVFDDWKSENAWYTKDEDMAAYANGIGAKLEKDHAADSDDPWDSEKILKEVAKKTKKAFEWKLKNPNREAATKVGSASATSKTSSANGKLPSFHDLPKEAKDSYRDWVKTDKNPRGIMSGEEFLRQYALKAGLLKVEEDEG